MIMIMIFYYAANVDIIRQSLRKLLEQDAIHPLVPLAARG